MATSVKRRFAWLLLGVAWLGAFTFLATAAVAQESRGLNTQRIWLVERAGNGNLLFRGNEPLTQGRTEEQNVPVKELIDLLKTKYKLQADGDPAFPDKFILVVFSLINGEPNAELPTLYREYRSFGGSAEIDGGEPFMKPGAVQPSSGYFQASPTVRAQLVWEPIAGLGSRPVSTSTKGDSQQIMETQIPVYSNQQRARPLYNAVTHLVQVMEDKADVPKVVYLHCMNGHDRTSEMSACYFLQSNPSLDLTGAMKKTVANPERMDDFESGHDGVPLIQQLKPDPGYALEWFHLYNRGIRAQVSNPYRFSPEKWKEADGK